MSKKAVIGMRYTVFAPITTDTTEAFVTGTPIHVPYVGTTSKSDKSSSTDIYADDELYASVNSVSGQDYEVTYKELDLQTAAEIGSGSYDEARKQLDMDFNENGKPYMFGYISATLDNGLYRTVQVLSTELKNIDLIGSPKTKESGVEVNEVKISLTAKRPKLVGQKPIIIREHETEAEAIAYLGAALTLPAVEA